LPGDSSATLLDGVRGRSAIHVYGCIQLELIRGILHRAEMLEFGGTDGGSIVRQPVVTECIAYVYQANKRVVEHQPCQQHTNPSVPRGPRGPSFLAANRHQSSFSTTLIGPQLRVNGYVRFNFQGGGEGTGARGAPVPVVGRRVKIKRSELRSRESLGNEEDVNSR
jgi:hypothetical protein